MNDRTPPQDRLLDLLADRAVQGLSDDEQAELDRLLAAHADEEVDAESFDRAAAAIDLGMGPGEFEPLPAELADRIRAAAPDFLPAERPSADGTMVESASARPQQRSARWVREALAVFIAAACLAFAALTWWARSGAPQAVDLAQQREQLMRDADDEFVVSFDATGDPAGPMAGGDVVWSNSRQQGFMRFRGLAANDPAQNQYQLWIFDAERDERYPVDGGVFDIPAGAEEVIIPIDAKIIVAKPTLFAITVERPGGVVVSDRSRLPLAAKAPDSTG